MGGHSDKWNTERCIQLQKMPLIFFAINIIKYLKYYLHVIKDAC